MDDLNEKISRLLSDPNSMATLRAAMASLGTDTPAAETPPAPASSPLDTLPDLTMLKKIAPLMGAFGKEDDDTRLLQALRPYLHGDREQRLDETMRMLKLTKLLPLLQEQGILDKLG